MGRISTCECALFKSEGICFHTGYRPRFMYDSTPQAETTYYAQRKGITKPELRMRKRVRHLEEIKTMKDNPKRVDGTQSI